MDELIVEKEMKKLEIKIHYHFRDLSLLSRAMYAKKIEVPGQGKNASNYLNEGLATVGDAVLKLILSDMLYKNESIAKGIITNQKSILEDNNTMYSLICGEGIIDYAYNDKHFAFEKDVLPNEKVSTKKHTPYLEAIIGAVYYDAGFDNTKHWVLDYIVPLLKKYSFKER